MAIVGGVAEQRRDSPPNGNIGLWASLGITRSPPMVQPSVIGPIRRFSSLRKLEWLFISLSAVALLACVGVTIENCETNKVDVTLAIVLLVNTLFCLFYVFRGVFGERPFELVALTCAFIIVTLYCIENYVFGPKNISKLVRLVVIAAASVGVIPLSIYLAVRYYRSGALIYRTLGSANARLQTLLRQRFACESLLTFDLQMAISMVILILRSYKTKGSQRPCTPLEPPNTALSSSLWDKIFMPLYYIGSAVREKPAPLSVTDMLLPSDVIEVHAYEIVILVVGLVVSVFWTITGVIALRYESRRLSVFVFFPLALVEPAYVVYKIVDAYMNMNVIDWTILVIAVLSFGSLSLLNRAAALVGYIICYRNFGKGLRERLDEQRRAGFSNSITRERNRSTQSAISVDDGTRVVVDGEARGGGFDNLSASMYDERRSEHVAVGSVTTNSTGVGNNSDRRTPHRSINRDDYDVEYGSNSSESFTNRPSTSTLT